MGSYVLPPRISVYHTFYTSQGILSAPREEADAASAEQRGPSEVQKRPALWQAKCKEYKDTERQRYKTNTTGNNRYNVTTVAASGQL